MNKNIFKVGFYLFSFVLLMIALNIVAEYRFMSEAGTRDISFDTPLNSILILHVIAISFGLITEFLIIKDWLKNKRIQAYTLLIAFLIFIVMGLAVVLIFI